jgi:hypothetical protein
MRCDRALRSSSGPALGPPVTVRRRLGITALVWVVGFAALRLSLLAPEHCPAVADQTAVEAAAAAGEWIAAGQTPTGRYLYEYDRAGDETRPGYNTVRHAGVTMSLYQLAAADPAGADAVLEVADRGLDELLDDLEPAGDGALVYVDPARPWAQLGANALMTAALAARRDATGDDRYDTELRALGRFMVGQMQPDGRMLAFWDSDAGAPVPNETSRYATGEAGWALARLHTLFPGEGWDDPARRVADYLATRRDQVEGLDFAPWPDQWAAYLLAELAPDGLSPAQVRYARGLAERFGMLLRTESQKDTWPVAFVDPRARGAGLGVWVEGLGSLLQVANAEPALADLRGDLQARLDCGAALLVDRQVDEGAAGSYTDPALVQGAWFRDDITRMDDQQHALSGLLAAAGRLPAAAGDGAAGVPEQSDSGGPS